MVIRTSENEVDVSDSVSGYRGIVRATTAFLNDEFRDSIYFPARLDVSPAPYDRCLSGLKIEKGTGPVLLREKDDILVASGGIKCLSIFCSYLDFPDGSGHRDHCHFDHFGDEANIHPDSVSAVFGVLDKTPNK